MKLQQLKYVLAVVEHGFNITNASEALFTSQPGVSKQIRLLEEELDLELFVRRGKRIVSLTSAGERMVERARRILDEVGNIKRLAREIRDEPCGRLRLGTTHTQARYVLPSAVRRFRAVHPGVEFDIHQGTSDQLADIAGRGGIDFTLATGSRDLFPELVKLPVYQWNRVLLVPRDHELATGTAPVNLAALARHPLVTYVFSDRPGSSLMRSFADRKLKPSVAFTARDADVIKTYVRMGLGVGVVAGMAVEPGTDDDLVALDAADLFPMLTTWIGFRRDTVLRQYELDFLTELAPHLTPQRIEAARAAMDQSEVDRLFEDVKLPLRGAEALSPRARTVFPPAGPRLAGC